VVQAADEDVAHTLA